MSDDDSKLALPDLEGTDGLAPAFDGALGLSDPETVNRGAADLEAVFDVPVKVSARPSTSMSTTVWSPAARWCWSKTSSAAR
jgi:hypothetical protein